MSLHKLLSAITALLPFMRKRYCHIPVSSSILEHINLLLPTCFCLLVPFGVWPPSVWLLAALLGAMPIWSRLIAPPPAWSALHVGLSQHALCSENAQVYSCFPYTINGSEFWPQSDRLQWGCPVSPQSPEAQPTLLHRAMFACLFKVY